MATTGWHRKYGQPFLHSSTPRCCPVVSFPRGPPCALILPAPRRNRTSPRERVGKMHQGYTPHLCVSHARQVRRVDDVELIGGGLVVEVRRPDDALIYIRLA